MNQHLSLSASQPKELMEQLARINIEVPLRTEGRTTEHCERYTMARFLATIAEKSTIDFPIRIEHKDRPDFVLYHPTGTVGIECTEAVSKEWAHIDAIRERDFPGSMIMLPMLKPGEKSLTQNDKQLIAQGKKSGAPWVGKMAERQWADAIAYFIGQKTEKLRAGNYNSQPKNWLLIQDEWRVPLYRLEHYLAAAQMCVERIQDFIKEPAFERIYVCNSKWLLRLAPGPIEIHEVNDLWNDAYTQIRKDSS